MRMPKTKPPRAVAVAIPYCPDSHRVLMITSRKHPSLWILPKGGIEEGESSGQAAVREAFEEAGVPATLEASKLLLTLDLPSTEHAPRASVWHVHAITVAAEADLDDDWLERDERKREWLSPRDVQKKIREWGGGDEVAAAPVRIGPKKAAKGGAMELAFVAFADEYGWDKALIEK